MNRLLTEPIPPPSEHYPELAPLDPVLRMALQREPSRRYQCASDFVEALEAVAREIGGVASPRDVARFARPWLIQKLEADASRVAQAIEALGRSEVPERRSRRVEPRRTIPEPRSGDHDTAVGDLPPIFAVRSAAARVMVPRPSAVMSGLAPSAPEPAERSHVTGSPRASGPTSRYGTVEAPAVARAVRGPTSPPQVPLAPRPPRRTATARYGALSDARVAATRPALAEVRPARPDAVATPPVIPPDCARRPRGVFPTIPVTSTVVEASSSAKQTDPDQPSVAVTLDDELPSSVSTARIYRPSAIGQDARAVAIAAAVGLVLLLVAAWLMIASLGAGL